MTFRGNCLDHLVQCKVNKDIFFSLLTSRVKKKCGSKGEVSVFDGISFPLHTSRKLLLEEHKLGLQLQQIEKERKQFLQKNSSERYMLQLTLRGSRRSEQRKISGHHLMSDRTLFHSSAADIDKEDREIDSKAWVSKMDGIYPPSGALNVRQLQVKKACPVNKMAESRSKSLPWKRRFDMPQVPPPSRSPSKTNIIWVRVRNSCGEMEIDGFLRTKRDIEQLLPKDKEIPAKIEVRLPQEKQFIEEYTHDVASKTQISKWIEDEKADTEASQVLYVNLAQIDSRTSGSEESLWMRQEQPVLDDMEKLIPTVKALKIAPNAVRKSSKPNFEEKTKPKVYEHDKYDREIHRLESGIETNESISTINEPFEAINTELSKIGGTTADSDKNPKSSESTGFDIQLKSSTDELTRNGSGNERERAKDADRFSVADDRKEKNKKMENEMSSGKNDKNKKSKQEEFIPRRSQKNNERKTRNSSAVQEMCIRAKTFTVIAKSTAKPKKKSRARQKTRRSTSRVHVSTSSATKLARKSCSACTVDSSVKAVRTNSGIRSKSDTSAYTTVRKALVLPRNDDVSSDDEGRRSCSPVAIVIPSKSQLENFDQAAKLKLRKTLALQMRKYCHTGSWAFPPTHFRSSELQYREQFDLHEQV